MSRRIGMCVCAAFATAALAGPLNPPAGQPQPSGPSLKDLEIKLNQILAGIGARADGERGGVNIYMTGSGLMGGSEVPGHEGAIELDFVSLSLGSEPAQGGGGQGGTPQPYLNPIVCGMAIDSAYTKIFQDCADGRIIPEIVILFCRTVNQTEQCYLTITLELVAVQSATLQIPLNQPPSNTIRLQPSILEFKYIPYVNGQPQTPIVGGWNFGNNTPA